MISVDLETTPLIGRFQDRDVQRLELVEKNLAHLRLLAIRADDDLFGPRPERERHPNGLPPCADDDGFLVPRLVTVAVGADVNGLTVAAVEAGNVGPEILDADGEQNSFGLDRLPAAKADLEPLTRFVERPVDDTVN